MLSQEWRCSWGSADRRCSNYNWVIDNFYCLLRCVYIRDLTVFRFRGIQRRRRFRPRYFMIWDELATTLFAHLLELAGHKYSITIGQTSLTQRDRFFDNDFFDAHVSYTDITHYIKMTIHGSHVVSNRLQLYCLLDGFFELIIKQTTALCTAGPLWGKFTG